MRAPAVALVLVLTAPRLAPADEAASGDYAIDAGVSAGYRMVDIDGAKDKYREDYNLRSGFRLFDLDVAGTAKAPDATPLDRFRLEVDTPGDEPVSHFRLSASDRPTYDLRADFTRSKYFYEVPQLFEQAVAGDVRLDDLHDFNLTRTNGVVDLTVRAPRLPTLFFGYRLYERHGDATSTVDVPEGDTFVVRAPVDTVTNVGRLGTEFQAVGTVFFLQQEYRRVDRRDDLGPVLTPAGVDPSDGSRLTLEDSNRSERLDIPATTVRVRRPIGDRTEVTGAYYYSHTDLDFDFQQRQTGTTDVPGLSASGTATGRGDATLDTQVADLGTSVRLAEPVRLHVDYRFHERSQDGTLDERSTLGRLQAVTGDHVRTQTVTSDVELVPRDDLSLRAGIRFARRDAHFTQTLDDVTTDAVGAVGAARWRPWSFLDLFARYEHAQVDDPLSSAGEPQATPPIPEREITLTFRNRASAGFQARPRDWATLRYELTADSQENDTFGGRAQVFANSASVAVTPLRDLTLFAGYTRRDVEGRADVRIAPLYAPTLSLQGGSEDVLTSELRYDFRVAGLAWSTGWDVAWITTEMRFRPSLEPGPVGSSAFDLDRIDGGTFLVLHHPWVEPSVEFRMIDYDERVLPRNDYRATILVFKLTKRWSR